MTITREILQIEEAVAGTKPRERRKCNRYGNRSFNRGQKRGVQRV